MGSSHLLTPEAAKRLLQIHAGRDSQSDPAKWSRGFVAALRASPDLIDDATFFEVMECIRVVAYEIAHSSHVDRELIAALWSLAYLPRYWAFHPHQLQKQIQLGGLDGGRLSRLADQLDRMAEAVDYALNGMPDGVEDALVGYGRPLPDYVHIIKQYP